MKSLKLRQGRAPRAPLVTQVYEKLVSDLMTDPEANATIIKGLSELFESGDQVNSQRLIELIKAANMEKAP